MPTKRQQADAIAALVREQVATVDRMAPEALRAVLPALRQARDELRVDLRDWLATVDGADRFTTYQKARALRALEATLAAVKETRPAIAAGLKFGRRATGPLAVENLDKEIERLSHIFGEALSAPQIDTAVVVAKGDRLLYRLHETSARRYAGELGEDIRQQLTVGLVKGETITEMVNRLRKLDGWKRKIEKIDPGAHAGDISDAFFNRWRFKADRLVRTEVMRAYNVQHHEGLVELNDQRPEGEDEFLEKWDAAADVVVCDICHGLDGRVRRLGGLFRYDGTTWGGPPVHPHCRCILIAWLARWGSFVGAIPAR